MLLHIPDKPGIDTKMCFIDLINMGLTITFFYIDVTNLGLHDTSVIEVNNIWVQNIFIDEVFGHF